MKITIESNTGTFDFACEGHERILYAGLRQGVGLPYECATGTCGTCRGRLVQGGAHVEWEAAPGFARLKRDKGDLLMCQARPTADCVLRVPAKIAPHDDPDTLPAHRTGRIAGVRRLTGDVLDFELVLSRPMTFEAGQFVVLEAEGVTGGRGYSMVNFARDTERLRLVVKQKPDGRFTEWLFGGAPEGSQVAVFGPLGAATFRPKEDKHILCIAGGSGIAGMMSILARAAGEGYFARHRGHVYFGVRTLDDAFYLEELARLVAAAGGALEVVLALSHQAVERSEHAAYPGIRLAAGLVDDVAAQGMDGKYDDVVAFLAGPPPMVDTALRRLMTVVKLPRTAIRYDKFS